MAVTSLNHINIRTSKVEDTRRFYEDIIGFRVGPRPPFDQPGYWLYSGEVAVVHLSECDHNPTPRTNPTGMGNGLDHVGFQGEDVFAMMRHLDGKAVHFKTNLVANGTLVQLFIDDPNGVSVELAYPVTKDEGRRVLAVAKDIATVQV